MALAKSGLEDPVTILRSLYMNRPALLAKEHLRLYILAAVAGRKAALYCQGRRQIDGRRGQTPQARYSSAWLGWKGSNLRMTEPKPVALPLGYIPVFHSTCAYTRLFSPCSMAAAACDSTWNSCAKSATMLEPLPLMATAPAPRRSKFALISASCGWREKYNVLKVVVNAQLCPHPGEKSSISLAFRLCQAILPRNRV